MASHKTIVEDDIDILVAGAGMAGTGAAFEARYWGQDKKVVIAEKANIDRSGAVAQGLYAINTYMGTRFGENNPEDHVRYARIDLMGMVREDLAFDISSAAEGDGSGGLPDDWYTLSTLTTNISNDDLELLFIFHNLDCYNFYSIDNLLYLSKLAI